MDQKENAVADNTEFLFEAGLHLSPLAQPLLGPIAPCLRPSWALVLQAYLPLPSPTIIRTRAGHFFAESSSAATQAFRIYLKVCMQPTGPRDPTPTSRLCFPHYHLSKIWGAGGTQTDKLACHSFMYTGKDTRLLSPRKGQFHTHSSSRVTSVPASKPQLPRVIK